ncbi:hypothetical protein CAMGR0001_1443 [Campylobacter gracilis RM3268]|uniref:Uncharacterized protein n=1 Tax=Campylobacter gracilis RM3268 TaxID=553220 RepID=C8PJP3_9BACT|nr:hypothetical protein CAMGR0001_1443 [Campylobacter gracilis RM3268]
MNENFAIRKNFMRKFLLVEFKGLKFKALGISNFQSPRNFEIPRALNF